MPITDTDQRTDQTSQPLGSQGHEERKGPPFPRWLIAALVVCLVLIVAVLALRAVQPGEEPEPSPAPTQETTPEPTRPPEQTLEVQAPAEPFDSDAWFSDAVFIGDSRVDGLQLYSGITTDATFLEHTGLTVYEVQEGKQVIRKDGEKLSVLDALSGESYGKVYIALGINELGYFDPTGFAETFGDVVERIKELLPDAKIYIQSLIPVNTEKCKANDAAYYITNEGIASYNEALKTYFADKDVYLLGIPEDLVDENGEMLSEYCADGVHFKKDGYVLWLHYLEAHTEG